jgi:hypothetical protein
MAAAVPLPDGYLVSRRDPVHPDVYAVIARESEIDIGMLIHESDGWHALLHTTGECNEQAHADPADAMADLIAMVEFTLRWCATCGDAVDEDGQRAAIALDLGSYCAECRGEMADDGAFGYWPGEDTRPSTADRPDGIGAEEAAQIMAEEMALRATYDTRDCGCAFDPALGGRQVLVCGPHADEAELREMAS